MEVAFTGIESPNPLAKYSQSSSGYILTYKAVDIPAVSTVSLKNSKGEIVPIFTDTYESVTVLIGNDYKLYKTLLMIPKKALSPGETYTATVGTKTWSFTTAGSSTTTPTTSSNPTTTTPQ